MVLITFLDNDFEEIESTPIDAKLTEVIDVINSTREFIVGTNRLRYEKTGWTSIDFRNSEIEVQLNLD